MYRTDLYKAGSRNMVDAAKTLKERLALASQKQKAATAAKEKKAKDQDLVLPVTQKPSGPGMKNVLLQLHRRLLCKMPKHWRPRPQE